MVNTSRIRPFFSLDSMKFEVKKAGRRLSLKVSDLDGSKKSQCVKKNSSRTAFTVHTEGGP